MDRRHYAKSLKFISNELRGFIRWHSRACSKSANDKVLLIGPISVGTQKTRRSEFGKPTRPRPSFSVCDLRAWRRCLLVRFANECGPFRHWRFRVLRSSNFRGFHVWHLCKGASNDGWKSGRRGILRRTQQLRAKGALWGLAGMRLQHLLHHDGGNAAAFWRLPEDVQHVDVDDAAHRPARRMSFQIWV